MGISDLIQGLLKKFFKYSTIGPALIRFYIIPHVKLHRINLNDQCFHTHPWNGISFIFGSYYEQYPNIEPKLRILFNFVRAYQPHKVIVKKPVWTLFINFRRINENWYYGSKNKPWEGSDQERTSKSKKLPVTLYNYICH